MAGRKKGILICGKIVPVDNIKGHFMTITRHKWKVMNYCFQVGLYRQGLLHDMSKYGFTEFSVGCIYYQGNRSPNNAEREDKGYTSAWLHHKGRNKHHYEYWLDYDVSGDGTRKFTGMKMPIHYVVEMFIDRIAASKIYKGDNYNDGCPLAYYLNGIAGNLLHKDTAALLERLLRMLQDKGQKKTFRYIRTQVLKPGYPY